MDGWAFRELFSSIEDPTLRRLVELTAFGGDGPYARFWIDSFRSIGILHLLVVSGAQVGAIASAVEGGLLSIRCPRGLRSCVGLGAAISFTAVVGAPPPLVRGCLGEVLRRQTYARFRREVAMAGTFVLHVVLFPSHVGTLSFALSWGTALAAGALEAWPGPRFAKTALVSTVVQGVFFRIDSPLQLVALMSGNVFVGLLFETALVPLLGAGLAWTWFAAWIPGLNFLTALSGIQSLYARAVSAIAMCVLVAVEPFRYIQNR